MIRWVVILSLLQVVPFWRIFQRIGLPPWLSILASVPLVNLVVLYYVALASWPDDRRGNPPLAGPDAGF